MPSSSAARRAPATISPGARSPPMASTATGRAASAGEPAPALGSTQSTSTAWRPLYHPQFGQTTWGTLAWWHCGQTLRAGGRAPSSRPAGCGSWPWMSFSWGRPSSLTVGRPAGGVHVPASAPVGSRSGVLRASRRRGHPEHVEVAHRGSLGATQPQASLVAVGPARGAQAPAVLPAQRGEGQLEEHGVAHQGLEVHLRRRPADRLLVVSPSPALGSQKSSRTGTASSPPTGSAQRRHTPVHGRRDRAGDHHPAGEGLERHVGARPRPRRAPRCRPARPRRASRRGRAGRERTSCRGSRATRRS